MNDVAKLTNTHTYIWTGRTIIYAGFIMESFNIMSWIFQTEWTPNKSEEYVWMDAFIDKVYGTINHENWMR